MQGHETKLTAVQASNIEPRAQKSNYPELFAKRVSGKIKRQLGDYFGITKFGVNLTELPPGAESTILHRHSKQEEFIYILSGSLLVRIFYDLLLLNLVIAI
ncbi:MAG: cupin domain-containing protein [Bdellovibrio sp.]|nr:cupin domain-containing protein [Bdellovibrio sp.]